MTQPSQRSRPYDDFIPLPFLRAIKLRRHSPDGLVHKVGTTKRAGRTVPLYPWEKMELGDFFIVPLNGRSRHSLIVSFYQAAARHDLEIAVKEWVMPDGSPGYRVTVVIIKVSTYKLLAAKNGVEVKISDGRWKERKKKWEKNQRGRPAVSRTPPPPPKAKAKAKQPDLNNPFWAKEDEDA